MEPPWIRDATMLNFPCPVGGCTEKLVCRIDRDDHLIKHHPEVPPHICGHCKQGFHDFTVLNVHVLNHAEPTSAAAPPPPPSASSTPKRGKQGRISRSSGAAVAVPRRKSSGPTIKCQRCKKEYLNLSMHLILGHGLSRVEANVEAASIKKLTMSPPPRGQPIGMEEMQV